MKVNVEINYDHVSGYLRYGHKEGVLNMTKKEYAKFKKNPEEFFCEHPEMEDELDFVLDDYSIEEIGSIFEVESEIIEG